MVRKAGVAPVLKACLAAVFLVCLVFAGDARIDQALKLYNTTDFEESLKILQAVPDKTGPVYSLIGRDYYMLSDYKRATESLEKAVADEPGNPVYYLWLARAYGRRAETSSPFTAPGNASKARQNFEKAVQLNPHDVDALNDLFEYYLEAPGFLGGGLDKAQATAQRIAAVNPSEGHWAQAKLAEKRKEFGSAEEHLRNAISAAPQQVGKFIDLARFLAKQGRYQESDQSLERAEKIAPDSPKLMYARADLYIQTGRHLDVAQQLLVKYMKSSALTPDDPPRSDAAKLLRRVRGS